MVAFVDLSGRTFSRLSVLERAPNAANGRTRWLCRCACGKTVVIVGRQLTNGQSKSCGCLKADSLRIIATTHGLSTAGGTHPLYLTWLKMMTRCYNEDSPDYPNWGGRGISVCDRWRDDPRNFVQDMFPKPLGTTLDRIDNEKEYSPENCRWASYTTQNNNRRDNVMVDVNGTTMTVAQAESVVGLSRWTLYQRIKRGLSGEQLFAPLRRS